MTVTSELTVWCDRPGCGNWETVQTTSRREARRELAGEGWAYRKGGDPGGFIDLCRAHAENHTEECWIWVQGPCNCGAEDGSDTERNR